LPGRRGGRADARGPAGSAELVTALQTIARSRHRRARIPLGFLGALNKERFDLLRVDWMLPDGTGAELLT
jgi:hypothetical protein